MATQRMILSSVRGILGRSGATVPPVRTYCSSGSRSSYSYRSHTCGELNSSHVGTHVTLCGWIQKPRILGSVGVVFLPLSDTTGTTQVVTQNEEYKRIIKGLPLESVVLIKGEVINRPAKDINKLMGTGEIEVQVNKFEVLNYAKERLPYLPFSKASEDVSDEELKLHERYLEIRRAPLQRNLRLRSAVCSQVREFLLSKEFIEVETPTLFKPTPEGAKEFLVPTRDKGKFYSLTQSPQQVKPVCITSCQFYQFKQLLMVGGIDRYFQFARCYRDEDQRADRQPEFTQIDLEMSFVSERDVMELIEGMMTNLLQNLQFPSPNVPFSSITYRQAMDTYGTDKPDTRLGMKFRDFTDGWQKTVSDPVLKAIHLVSFSVSQEHFEQIKGENLIDHQVHFGSVICYHQGEIKVLANGGDTLTKTYSNQPNIIIDTIKKIFSFEKTHIFISFDDERKKDEMLTSLGRVRSNVASVLQKIGLLVASPQFELLWVTGFPLFNLENEEGSTRQVNDDNLVIKSAHHPFTAPVPDHEHLLYSKNIKDLTKIVSQQYDLVMNGWELGGGSIRIHNPAVQEHVLKNLLKTSTEKFSHLLRGLESGCPPHGGIALGLDRLMAVLCGTTSIREVIAFPKSSQGNDLLAGAPITLTSEELSEYSL